MRRYLVAIVLVLAWPGPAGAQQQPPDPSRPFEITDNSFLVEEAYNQERGVFQNIFGVVRSDTGEWAASFTQEWPAPSVRHQLSYTLVFDNDTGRGSVGDVAINYRYQLRTGEDGGVAVAPRASVLLRPDRSDTFETAHVGLELNLPASRQFGDIFVHGNAGVRIYPRVDSVVTADAQGSQDVSLASPFLAGSVILRVRPMLNLMMESLVQFPERIVGPATTERATVVTLSPGTRFGWNIGAQQIVLGAAVPIVHGDGRTSTGVFGYASWELPFTH